MSKSSKILATIGIVFIFMLFSAALQAGSGPGGRNPGILGLILMFGLIAGIRAIWKKPSMSKDVETTDLKKD